MSQRKSPTHPAPYAIRMREGCTLVYGHMPLGEFLDLLKNASDSDMLDPEIARMLGATAALGPRAALERIRRQERAAQPYRTRETRPTSSALDADALRWLAIGEQDRSSLSLFTLLTGVCPLQHGGGALELPASASEFRLCRLLVEQVPALRHALRTLAGRVAEPDVTPWAALAESWDDLCTQLQHEAPDWHRGVHRAPSLEAMLGCFHEVATDHAELHSSRMTTAAMALPFSHSGWDAHRFNTPRWLM